MTTVLELAQQALDRSAGDVQVTVTQERSLFARFARSEPTQCTGIENTAVEVAAWVDGHVGIATTNELREEALAACAERARSAAEALARGGAGKHPGPVSGGAIAPSGAFDPATAELDPAVSGAALRDVFAVASRVKLAAHGLWTAGDVETAIVTSGGVQAVDRVTDAHLKVILRDADGRSGYAAGTAPASGKLDATAIATRAADRVVPGALLTLPPGEYPVVLEAAAVGLILDFVGMLGFNGLAHAEERGALVGRLGTQVAAPSITLVDDPTRGLARAFDAEGTPKAPLALITDGVAQQVAHDRNSATIAGDGAVSTGHALRAGGDPYGALPLNLVLNGGDADDVAALCAPIERGIYVTRFWYVNTVHERQTLLTGMSRDGTFLIEDGKLGPRIHDVRFTDSALRILSATEALTSAQELVSEAEFYGTRYALATTAPALRAQGFRVTGATTD